MSSSVLLDGVVIANNTAEAGPGGGIALVGLGSPQPSTTCPSLPSTGGWSLFCSHSTLSGNSASWGGGLFVGVDGGFRVQTTEIVGNVAQLGGGGLAFGWLREDGTLGNTTCNVTLNDSRLAGNEGGALYSLCTGEHTLEGNSLQLVDGGSQVCAVVAEVEGSCP